MVELLLRSCRVDLGCALHDAIALGGHVARQPVLDDGQHELEQRSVRLLHLECGLAGVDLALLDRQLLISFQESRGTLFFKDSPFSNSETPPGPARRALE